MPRKTRAAAKAEEAVLADEDNATQDQELANPPTPSKRDREPLRSISPTSVESLDNERQLEVTEEMPKAKAKGKKKGGKKAKGKKAKAEKEDQPEIIDEAGEDGSDAAPDQQVDDEIPAAVEETPVDAAAVEEPVTEDSLAGAAEVEEEPEAKPAPVERPASSLGRSTRSTRRQQAKAEEEEVATTPVIEEPPEPKAIAGELVMSPPQPEPLELEGEPGPIIEEEQIPVVAQDTAVVEEQVIASEAIASPNLSELPDRTRPEALSLVASNASSRRPSSQIHDPIEALDAMEDEIDEVAKIIPGLDSPTSPVKPTKPAAAKAGAKNVKPTAKAPVSRTPGVRSKLTNTTQPSATQRIRALAEPRKPATATTSRTAAPKPRPQSVYAPKAKVPTEKKEGAENKSTETKRRPISLHFPAPPPPPKSKKPVTTSNFTLPGDAIAAKLKQQRLERQKREEEEAAKRREFKARPVPTIPPRSVDIKQTAASRARQSIAPGAEKENTSGLRRAGTVTGASTTAASKRNSVTVAKRSSVIGAPKPTTSTIAQKRGSIIASKPRPVSMRADSSSSNPTAPRNVSASEVAAQRVKGREVYNRDRYEKEARESEQKKKEDAAKKARAEAAERGRQASREWAEKQKRAAVEKKMSASQATSGASGSPTAEVSPQVSAGIEV